MNAPTVPNWPAVISSERLRLRPAHRDDLASYRTLWTDTEVRRYLGGPVEGERLKAFEQHFTSPPYIFSVIDTASETMVGSLNIKPAPRFEDRREISYSFLPEHWGHGYAREAVYATLAWAFDAVPSPDPTIIAITQEANTRSRRLLESVGMTKIESFIEFDAPQALYAIAKEDL